MPPFILHRVAVLGTSGSGKTTLARSLAARLDVPCVELDALYWGADWTPRPSFEQEVRVAVQQPRWVIDGNYSGVRDTILRRATAIVWLDYALPRVVSRALSRTLRRVSSGERLYGGNRETLWRTLFDLETPLWLAMRTHRRRRRELAEFFGRPEYRHANVIRLDSPAAAERFLTRASAPPVSGFDGAGSPTGAE